MKVDTSEINERVEFVADEKGGIQPVFEAFYLISVIYSASRCLDAFERYS
ncbi:MULTISPECIES: hypothetical protein [Thiomicrorhabdus]|uniref:Transposase n=1 Tax=Thiomicrorhabdus heinhorstiae TaxID=2748010 RepID=A0ABS0BTI5_9GAMM|nr:MULTISPECIES: hypothetical protein [Thiomicrorhabdus]MBF6057148.1 hypothetical protein [Thiomicrorhabdus heinhorstiae]